MAIKSVVKTNWSAQNLQDINIITPLGGKTFVRCCNGDQHM